MAELNTLDEEIFGKAYDARLMKRLLGYLRPYKWQVAIAITVLIFASATQVVGPWLTQIIIDEAIPSRDTSFLALLVAGYVTAIVLGAALTYLQGIITTWLGQSVMYDLRAKIFQKFQHMDVRFYDKNPVGRLMTRITNDVETLNELFSSGLVTVFGDVFTLSFIVVAMLNMNWRLALVSFSVLPFVFVIAFVFRAKIRTAYRDIRRQVARLNAFIHERFTGIQIVQLFNKEKQQANLHSELNQSYLDAHLRSITYYALFFPIIQFFTALALALIIWYGGLRTLDGAITVGVLAAFLQYARRFFRPIQDLSEKYNLLQGAMASSERIFKLLDEKNTIEDPIQPILLPAKTHGRIEFRDTWFAYGEDKQGNPDWILKDVSFTIAAGEKVAIVGHTGAGKTTIINLLMRFYDVDKGQILLDDIPIKQMRLQDIRCRVGLVLQDVFLFNQDVEYNIRLGSTEISHNAIRQAAKKIGASHFIERLANAYTQPVGERGSALSVGERQLVSFARALAFDPDILVLDEATSSVDSEIEAQIESATEALLKDRTSLVIAHRLSTVQNADRILVLHKGRLQEQGTHQELLSVDGIYSRLHELQFATAVT